MRVQFVDDGVDFSFEVDLSDLAREQISLQTHLGSDDRFRERFASLLREGHLMDLSSFMAWKSPEP
jgi:hypothetical protein